ncbi:MAG: hypothetical protein M1484_02510 [Patescibacteria group bacterium]|nr:hypothetical protein [Patescibacteria group bacterium]MCL5431953.1 hypothetical protein [Patescibacteria group bacterium]
MVVVNGLIWDDWNREHLDKHRITIEEVEEVCHGKYKTGESFRKRIVLDGKTKSGKMVTVILSSEDRDSQPYEEGIYYVITAFESEVQDVQF